VFSCSKIEQVQWNTWVSFQSAQWAKLGQFSVSGNSVSSQLFGAKGLENDLLQLPTKCAGHEDLLTLTLQRQPALQGQQRYTPFFTSRAEVNVKGVVVMTNLVSVFH